RAAEPGDHVRHREGLARAGHAEQGLEAQAVLDSLDERVDRARLVASRGKRLVQLEWTAGEANELRFVEDRFGHVFPVVDTDGPARRRPGTRCLGRQARASFATLEGAAWTTFGYAFAWCLRPRKPGRKTRDPLSCLRSQKASAPQHPSA